MNIFNSRNIRVIVTFWGDKYLEWFCTILAPSLLGEGNLSEFKNNKNAIFLICTTIQDWEKLEKTSIFEELNKNILVKFVNLPLNIQVHKYVNMSLGHKLLTEECYAEKAVAIYLAVDTLIPSNSIKELSRLSNEGRKIVLCTAIRFGMNGVIKELKNNKKWEIGQPISISKSLSVEIGLKNLHPESLAGNFEESYFGELSAKHGRNHFPTCCYWLCKDKKSMVIYTHNWAPFLIDYQVAPKHDISSFDGWAIDGDYIYKNFKDLLIGSEIYIAQDSDCLFLLGLTPEEEMAPNLVNRWWKQIPFFKEFAKGTILNLAINDIYVDPLRREIYKLPVTWHGKVSSPDLDLVKKKSNELIKKYHEKNINIERIQKIIVYSINIKNKLILILFYFNLILSVAIGNTKKRNNAYKILSNYFRYKLNQLFNLSILIINRIFGEHVSSYWECIWRAILGDELERIKIRKRVLKIREKYK